MGPARAYFPLVGLALGGILAGLDFAAREALPSPVVGALLVVAMLVLTRAIHTEGFLDSCDGLFGGHSPERRLEIFRDSHVGAFAVIGCVGLLLMKWTLLTSISGDIRVGLLILFPCLSRFGMLATMAAFPYARSRVSARRSRTAQKGGTWYSDSPLPRWRAEYYWESAGWCC